MSWLDSFVWKGDSNPFKLDWSNPFSTVHTFDNPLQIDPQGVDVASQILGSKLPGATKVGGAISGYIRKKTSHKKTNKVFRHKKTARSSARKKAKRKS